jgi:hypothetical protein
VVIRYLGTSAETGSARSAVASVCHHLVAALGCGDSFSVPLELKDLAVALVSLMEMATPARPIVVYLDSLDQLSDDQNGRMLDWLPRTVPAHAALIVSTLPDIGGCYKRLQAIFPGPLLVSASVDPLHDGDGASMIGAWLARDGRTLTDPQCALLLRRFAGCPSPLFLNLAYRVTRDWRSYDEVLPVNLGPRAAADDEQTGSDGNKLDGGGDSDGGEHSGGAESTRFLCEATGRPVTVASDVASVIGEDIFAALELEHGRELVAAVASLLTVSAGVSRSELLDMLSLNESVLDAVFEWWKPPVRRVPPLILARLIDDLSGLVARRGADGVTVYSWHHRQLWTAAEKRYLSERGAREEVARSLADYFSGKWARTPKPHADSPGAPASLRRVYPHSLHIETDDAASAGSALAPSSASASSTTRPAKSFSSPSTRSGGIRSGARRVPNLRVLTELPRALVICEDWDTLTSLLCSFSYLSASLSAGRLYATIHYLNTLVANHDTYVYKISLFADKIASHFYTEL